MGRSGSGLQSFATPAAAVVEVATSDFSSVVQSPAEDPPRQLFSAVQLVRNQLLHWRGRHRRSRERRESVRIAPFVEIFDWKSEEASRVAHEHPEVMAIWEPMDKLTEKRDGRPNMEFPHVQPITVLE